jgi:hypothetical protein
MGSTSIQAEQHLRNELQTQSALLYMLDDLIMALWVHEFSW